MMIAEESTAWPMVSRPTYLGGLGFGFKWNMGWMHDMLDYMSKDPIYRSYHHSQITFSLMYAFTENFILPFSHDEVVHGKGSMISKMPGDDWRKFANLRALYGFMIGHPGKKLLFMGGEFGQWNEWNHDTSLDWHLLGDPSHNGLQRWVRDLNTFYRGEPALYELDADAGGFEWIDCNDSQRSIVSFLRKGRQPGGEVLFVCNFTPEPRQNYRIGVPHAGEWKEVLNGDATLVRRKRAGQPGNRIHGARPDARPSRFAESDAAAAGDDRVQEDLTREGQRKRAGPALVQGRHHLRDPRQGLLRQQQRRHRRFPGPDAEAGLSAGPGGHLPVAAAVLSLAAAGRRVRHLRLHQCPSQLRNAGRLQGLPERGARAQHAGADRAGGQPHLRSAPLVPGGAQGSRR